MTPSKLSTGDEIRVVAPARSLALPWINQELKDIANKRFADLGLKLTFGQNVNQIDKMSSTSIEARVSDLHQAFLDKNVKGIITVIGGYNSIEILPFLNYDIIRDNPKVVCGYSDITAILSAIYAKTGLLTYYGPHYFDFGDLKGFDYTLEYFKKCLFKENEFTVHSSVQWSDEKWGKDQQKRHFNENSGYISIKPGEAEGLILGGNISTLQLLKGTNYFPSTEDKFIWFLEDDSEYSLDHLNRNLVSLALSPGFQNCAGVVLGRFQAASEIGMESLMSIFQRNSQTFGNIPVIANADFGHTTPRITIPIGGRSEIISGSSSKIKILEH